MFIVVTLSGCGGGPRLRHESWPGLIAHEGTLYAANLERIQAFNAETGKLLWSYPESDKEVRPFYSTPVLVEDYPPYGLLLAAGYQDRTVYAFKLGESAAERPGEPVWTFSQAGGQYVGTGTATEDMFIIGNGDGNVYALALEDGVLRWEFSTGDRVWATPVVVGSTVYVASLDHHLYALDLLTGQEQWRVTMGGAIAGTPALVGGDLWVGDFTSTLYQVDLERQEIVWTYEAQDWLWASPTVDGSRLYFSDVGGNVYALDTETRTMVWDKPVSIGDIVRGQAVVNHEEQLLFVPGHELGEIHAINLNSGTKMNWGPELPKNPGQLPSNLVATDEQLYAMPILVATRIRALDFDTGGVLWTYPPIASE